LSFAKIPVFKTYVTNLLPHLGGIPVNRIAMVEGFEALVRKEKKITAEVVEALRKIGTEKIYLDRGHTSLFSYLTKGLGYAPASAQRRIDAARLMEVSPEVQQDLESGALNLSQISVLSQGFRQKEVSREEKRELVEKIRGQDLVATQVMVAKELDLPIVAMEKTRHQKDESVRLELTFTKEQMEILQRVKEVLSHKQPNPSWAELLVMAASELLRKKDPRQNLGRSASKSEASLPSGIRSAASDAAPNSKAAIKRAVFQRDDHCQWRDPASGKKCGSRFQLQLDHIQPRWAKGESTLENLQLLCGVHNRLKFERYG